MALNKEYFILNEDELAKINSIVQKWAEMAWGSDEVLFPVTVAFTFSALGREVSVFEGDTSPIKDVVSISEN